MEVEALQVEAFLAHVRAFITFLGTGVVNKLGKGLHLNIMDNGTTIIVFGGMQKSMAIANVEKRFPKAKTGIIGK